jgi:molecular chaperone GrpE
VKNQNSTSAEDAENLEADAGTTGQTAAAEMDANEAETSGQAGGDTLTEAQQRAQSFFEGWQRERADFANYKKRAERDLMTMRFNAKIDTLRSLVPILDDFERAMDNKPETLDSEPWLEGILAIQRKLAKTLEDEGILPIDPVGELFDPNRHEAIGQDSDTEVASGHVSATLQKGYVCGDRVLRPALVRVAE